MALKLVSPARNRVNSGVRRVRLIRNWFKKQVFLAGIGCCFFGIGVALAIEGGPVGEGSGIFQSTRVLPGQSNPRGIAPSPTRVLGRIPARVLGPPAAGYNR